MMSNPEFVYLLWDHDERGPERLVATLDKNKVVILAEGFNGHITKDRRWFDDSPTILEDIKQLLVEHKEGKFSLMGGWGGLYLQIVRLS